MGREIVPPRGKITNLKNVSCLRKGSSHNCTCADDKRDINRNRRRVEKALIQEQMVNVVQG